MSLYESLQERLDNKPYSNYFSTWCPFDEHQSQALLVYDDGRFWCLSCHKSGTIEYLDRFIGSHYRLTQRQSTKFQLLPKWRAWEREYGDVEGIANHAHKSLLKFPQFQSYFKKRKIDEYISQGKFGYISGWNLFPIFTPDGRIVDIVVRAGKTKGDARYVLRPDSGRDTPYLYCPSWDRVRNSDTIIVCFGVVDSWAFESLGLACITGTTGKSISAESLKSINKRFVIVPDQGEERDAHILSNKLGWRSKVMSLCYPENTKDPDEIRILYGNSVLRDMIRGEGVNV